MGNHKMNRAVFLDRDGVLNPAWGKDVYDNPESPLRFEDFHLFPDVPRLIRKINKMGFLAIVITNQPAVAKGKMAMEDLEKMHNLLLSETEKAGGKIEKIFACLHHPDPKQVKIPKFFRECSCRKPKPGMLISAAVEFHINLHQSWMIGDSWKDVAAGNMAGCQTILIGEHSDHYSVPDFTARDLSQAIKIISRNL